MAHHTTPDSSTRGSSSWFTCCLLVTFRLVFTSASENAIEYTLIEEQAPLTFVGNVPVSANLRQTLNSSLLANLKFSKISSGNAHARYFQIEEQDGILRTDREIDREIICPKQEVCVLKLDIAAHSPPDFFKLIKIAVTVEDRNDDVPKFAEAEISRTIPENTAPGGSFSLPFAEDLDSPQYGIKEYNILSGSSEFSLKVNRDSDNHPSDAYLVLDSAVDRESRDQYRIVIAALDGGVPPNSGSIIVNIIISDVNDHPPRFTNQTYRSTVREDAPAGSVILTVRAQDPDVGDNAAIMYSLTDETPQNYASKFILNNATGEISVRTALDYEDINNFNLQVTAMDVNGEWLPSEARVVIRVLDVNDNPPLVNVDPVTPSGLMEIPENSPKGSYIAYIAVDDPESGAAGVRCSMDSDQFNVEPLPESGFKLVTLGSLDREVTAAYDLKFICTDDGSPRLTSTTTVRVNVKDENDNPPVFPQSTYVASVQENQPSGSHVITVNVEDADRGKNAEIRFSLLSDVSELSIDPVSGEVTTSESLDREVTANFTVVVQARDLGSESMSSTATLVVLITDVNDEAPAFNSEHFTFTVNENVPQGTKVGKLTAKDRDSAPNAVFQYSLENQPRMERLFWLDALTGDIFTKSELDRESASSYSLVFKVTDVNRPSLSSTCKVRVDVEDENDNAPVVGFPSETNNTLSIPNYARTGSMVTSILARDADTDTNGRITYHLSGDTESLRYFAIDQRSGEVTSTRSLRDAWGKVFILRVLVRDHGSPPHTVERELQLVVNRTEPGASSDSGMIANHNLVIVISVVVCSAVLIILLIIAIVMVKRKDPSKHTKNNLKILFADQNFLSVNTDGHNKMPPPHGNLEDGGMKRSPREVSFSNDVSISDEFPDGVFDSADQSFHQIYIEKTDADGASAISGCHGDTDSGRGSNEDCDSCQPCCGGGNQQHLHQTGPSSGSGRSRSISGSGSTLVDSSKVTSSHRAHHETPNSAPETSRDRPSHPPILPPKDTPAMISHQALGRRANRALTPLSDISEASHDKDVATSDGSLNSSVNRDPDRSHFKRSGGHLSSSYV